MSRPSTFKTESTHYNEQKGPYSPRGCGGRDTRNEFRSPRNRSALRPHFDASRIPRIVIQAAETFIRTVGDIARCVTERDTLRKLYKVTIPVWHTLHSRADVPKFNDVLYYICYGMRLARVKRDTFIEWNVMRKRTFSSRDADRYKSRDARDYRRRSDNVAQLTRTVSNTTREHLDHDQSRLSSRDKETRKESDFTRESGYDTERSRKRQRVDPYRDPPESDDETVRREDDVDDSRNVEDTN